MPFVAFDLQGTILYKKTKKKKKIEKLTLCFKKKKGTLCTFEKVIKVISETQVQQKDDAIAKEFFSYWYTCALRDYIGTSQAGKYSALIKILKFTLPRALLCFRDGLMRCNETEMQDIMTCFDQIEPDAQAMEALDLLVLNKWDIWVLSVGSMERTESLLDRTGLKKYIGDNILCCDDLNLSKPHPKVYSELMRLAVHRTQRIEVSFFFYLLNSILYQVVSFQITFFFFIY